MVTENDIYEQCIKKISIAVLKQICIFLKIRGCSKFRKTEVASKIKVALSDSEYLTEIKENTKFEEVEYKFAIGTRLRSLENALNLPNVLSTKVLSAYKEKMRTEKICDCAN